MLATPRRDTDRRERGGPQVQPEKEQIKDRRDNERVAGGRFDPPAPGEGAGDGQVGGDIDDHEASAESLAIARQRTERSKRLHGRHRELNLKVHVRTIRSRADGVVVVEVGVR